MVANRLGLKHRRQLRQAADGFTVTLAKNDAAQATATRLDGPWLLAGFSCISRSFHTRLFLTRSMAMRTWRCELLVLARKFIRNKVKN